MLNALPSTVMAKWILPNFFAIPGLHSQQYHLIAITEECKLLTQLDTSLIFRLGNVSMSHLWKRLTLACPPMFSPARLLRLL